MPRRSLRRGSDRGRRLLATFAFVAFSLPASAEVDVVAIVNPANTAGAITMHDLRLLYSLYRRTWDGGVRVVLILPEPGTPAMDFLSKNVFRKRDATYVEQYYLTALFQQRIAELPRSSGDLLAISLVEREVGSIAIVERRHAAHVRGVRMVEIELPRESKNENVQLRGGGLGR